MTLIKRYLRGDHGSPEGLGLAGLVITGNPIPEVTPRLPYLREAIDDPETVYNPENISPRTVRETKPIHD